eukprot:scaffold3064_cov231-Pinguiococcus_pyrenoidosus.AAC.7
MSLHPIVVWRHTTHQKIAEDGVAGQQRHVASGFFHHGLPVQQHAAAEDGVALLADVHVGLHDHSDGAGHELLGQAARHLHEVGDVGQQVVQDVRLVLVRAPSRRLRQKDAHLLQAVAQAQANVESPQLDVHVAQRRGVEQVAELLAADVQESRGGLVLGAHPERLDGLGTQDFVAVDVAIQLGIHRRRPHLDGRAGLSVLFHVHHERAVQHAEDVHEAGLFAGVVLLGIASSRLPARCAEVARRRTGKGRLQGVALLSAARVVSAGHAAEAQPLRHLATEVGRALGEELVVLEQFQQEAQLVAASCAAGRRDQQLAVQRRRPQLDGAHLEGRLVLRRRLAETQERQPRL